MEEDEVPKVRSFSFIHVHETARQKQLKESYNWKITPEGWLRMDKKTPYTPPPLQFSGQCYDEGDNVWTTCFKFKKDGSIQGGNTSVEKLRSIAGNVEIDLDEVCLPALSWLVCPFPSKADV